MYQHQGFLFCCLFFFDINGLWVGDTSVNNQDSLLIFKMDNLTEDFNNINNNLKECIKELSIGLVKSEELKKLSKKLDSLDVQVDSIHQFILSEIEILNSIFVRNFITFLFNYSNFFPNVSSPKLNHLQSLFLEKKTPPISIRTIYSRLKKLKKSFYLKKLKKFLQNLKIISIQK
jgi:hypothetical protein